MRTACPWSNMQAGVLEQPILLVRVRTANTRTVVFSITLTTVSYVSKNCRDDDSHVYILYIAPGSDEVKINNIRSRLTNPTVARQQLKRSVLTGKPLVIVFTPCNRRTLTPVAYRALARDDSPTAVALQGKHSAQHTVMLRENDSLGVNASRRLFLGEHELIAEELPQHKNTQNAPGQYKRPPPLHILQCASRGRSWHCDCERANGAVSEAFRSRQRMYPVFGVPVKWVPVVPQNRKCSASANMHETKAILHGTYDQSRLWRALFLEHRLARTA